MRESVVGTRQAHFDEPGMRSKGIRYKSNMSEMNPKRGVRVVGEARRLNARVFGRSVCRGRLQLTAVKVPCEVNECDLEKTEMQQAVVCRLTVLLDRSNFPRGEMVLCYAGQGGVSGLQC